MGTIKLTDEVGCVAQVTIADVKHPTASSMSSTRFLAQGVVQGYSIIRKAGDT